MVLSAVLKARRPSLRLSMKRHYRIACEIDMSDSAIRSWCFPKPFSTV